MNFQEKVEKNIWDDNLDEVIATIKELSSKNTDWTWSRNTRCKYIQIRFDMRDGAFVLLDREGDRISLDNLKHQYKD